MDFELRLRQNCMIRKVIWLRIPSAIISSETVKMYLIFSVRLYWVTDQYLNQGNVYSNTANTKLKSFQF